LIAASDRTAVFPISELNRVARACDMVGATERSSSIVEAIVKNGMMQNQRSQAFEILSGGVCDVSNLNFAPFGLTDVQFSTYCLCSWFVP
jgi:hypothetical protein